MLDGRWRAGVERGLGPLGDRLRRLGVTPDTITAIGLVLSAVTAWLIATGRFGWAVLGVVLAGLGDLLDGAVARRSGQTSPRGAFFDSVADRLSDALLLGGAAWYLAGTSEPRLAVLAFAVGALSMTISYERAKAESLGLSARGGLMERAERFVLLAIGLAFDVLVPVLWVMFVLTAYTAVDRFRRVWRQADRPVRPARVHARRRRAERPDGVPDAPGGNLRTWWEARRPAASRSRRHPSGSRRTRP
jgi:CDP-diacylglycerol--glycerol-3-phosphate 3-phosphatidyltransferase